jgi:HSP20 family protein
MAGRDMDEWFWKIGTDLQRMSEEMSRSGPTLATNKFWEPRVDLFEDSETLFVRAEIAGARSEDINLGYLAERHSLLIRGCRHEENPPSGQRGFYQLEIYYGEFAREIRLPEVAIDPEGIRAHYRNGFLTVVIPKSE